MLALLVALAFQAAPDPTLVELQRAYDQTCNSRIYGQFDDLCSDMADRIKAYRRELRRRPKPKTGNAPPPSPAKPPTPTTTPSRSAPMPDQASTPNPVPPTDAAPDTPSPAGPNSTDSLVRAFEAVRDTGPRDDDHAEIAADDAGGTSLAEEMGAGSQKPA